MNCPQNVKNDKNNHLWLYMMIIVWNISTFLYNIERIFTNGSLKLQWLNGTGSWGVFDGPNSHQLVGSDFFVPWLATKPQEPMMIAWVNRSQQLLQQFRVSSHEPSQNSLTFPWHFPDHFVVFPDHETYYRHFIPALTLILQAIWQITHQK